MGWGEQHKPRQGDMGNGVLTTDEAKTLTKRPVPIREESARLIYDKSVLRERHGQQISSCTYGDCFRASMSVILDVPNGDYLPTNDGSDNGGWWFDWHYFLWDLGLAIQHANAKGPIWKSHRWVASVVSKNCEGATHSIVMEGDKVLFDPSQKRRYHAGWSLLGSDAVVGGYWLEVADVRRLDALLDFRKQSAEISAIPS